MSAKENKMSGSAEAWETDLLYSVGGSVSTVILGLIVYCVRNKMKHSKVKCMSACCEFTAQEDSIRKETGRLEELVSVLKEKIVYLERNAEQAKTQGRQGEGSLTDPSFVDNTFTQNEGEVPKEEPQRAI